MNNRNLVRELRKKLEWYTFEALEEEFNAEEVQNILMLLDRFDPIPEVKRLDVDKQLIKFKELVEKGRFS